MVKVAFAAAFQPRHNLIPFLYGLRVAPRDRKAEPYAGVWQDLKALLSPHDFPAHQLVVFLKHREDPTLIERLFPAFPHLDQHPVPRHRAEKIAPRHKDVALRVVRPHKAEGFPHFDDLCGNCAQRVSEGIL